MDGSTDILILLDRSGSMETGKSDHEGGLRSFVRDSRNLPGDPKLTFVRFDSNDPFEVVLDRKPMRDVQESEISLTPRGGTPLLDAVGQLLTKYDALGEGTIVMIVTDGAENASTSYKKGVVKDLVMAKEARGWKILFLGANIDAFAEAGAVGISVLGTMAMSAAGEGTQNAYRAFTANVGSTYSARLQGASVNQSNQSMNWTKEQRVSSAVSDASSLSNPTGAVGANLGGLISQVTPPKAEKKDDDKEKK